MLCACKRLLSAIEKDSGDAELWVDFSKVDTLSEVKALFTKINLQGLVEGKDYRALDTVFPFVFGFIDRVPGRAEEVPMTKVLALYSDFTHSLTDYRSMGRVMVPV